MITEARLGEFRMRVSLPGALTTGVKAIQSIPYNCQLKSVNVNSRAAGITGSQIVDIQKAAAGSGAALASIFSGAGKANTSNGPFQADSLGPFTAGATTFAKNDIVAINVTQVHSGTPANDTTIDLIFQRFKGVNLHGSPVLGETE